MLLSSRGYKIKSIRIVTHPRLRHDAVLRAADFGVAQHFAGWARRFAPLPAALRAAAREVVAPRLWEQGRRSPTQKTIVPF
jgi:hypothetical protein